MPVDGGMINGCISDLQSKFNLNNFTVGYTTPTDLSTALSGVSSSSAKTWNNLLRYLEMPVFPGRVEAIIDWVDKGAAAPLSTQSIIASTRPGKTGISR